MKIAHICPYSAGACGVWMRVKQEAKEFVKHRHEVKVFSTNRIKESDKIAPAKEIIEGIEIQRFPATKLGGESFMFWDFEKELFEFHPDIIVAHNYRHIHTSKALTVRDELRKSRKKTYCFLVTHAPFVEGNITRTRLQTLVVKFYDKFIGPRKINSFDKVLPISHWEISHLRKIGLKKEKIFYIPNGIPKEFFKVKKKSKQENKILFLGRVSPKKKLETLFQSLKYLKDKKITIEIVGPQEKNYFKFLKSIIKKEKQQKRIKFSEPVYDINKKIEKIDSCKLFVLPSRVEGMPQSLIEAMSRGKIVIGSDSKAIRDLIKNGENGFLFQFNNPKDLAKKIDNVVSLSKKDKTTYEKKSKNFAKQFNWDEIYKKLNSLYSSFLK